MQMQLSTFYFWLISSLIALSLPNRVESNLIKSSSLPNLSFVPSSLGSVTNIGKKKISLRYKTGENQNFVLRSCLPKCIKIYLKIFSLTSTLSPSKVALSNLFCTILSGKIWHWIRPGYGLESSTF